MPRPIGELSGNGIIAEMRAELRRLWRAVGSNQGPVGEYDEYTLASSSDSAHTLTYIPSPSLIPIACLNGLPGRYGTDYTVDFTTGIVTWSATKVAGDILSVFYQTTGDLVALSGPVDDGLTTLADWTQDAGAWALDGGSPNKFLVSGAASGATRTGCYALIHNNGSATVHFTADAKYSNAATDGFVFALNTATGSTYRLLWDGGSFNGGLTLLRYSNNTTAVQIGTATGNPITSGVTYDAAVEVVYDSSTGAISIYFDSIASGLRTLRISVTDATPLTGTWFGAVEGPTNLGAGRWWNWSLL